MSSPRSCNLLYPDPVVAVLPLSADVTASCPIHHIFGGFSIYGKLNVDIVVWTASGVVFLPNLPAKSIVNKTGTNEQKYKKEPHFSVVLGMSPCKLKTEKSHYFVL